MLFDQRPTAEDDWAVPATPIAATPTYAQLLSATPWYLFEILWIEDKEGRIY